MGWESEALWGRAGNLSHLSLLLRHHVQLLLAHPGLRLSRVKVVLLGPVCLLKPLVALLGLLNEEAPQLLEVSEPSPDGLSIEAAAVGDNVLAPLKDVIDARLVSLDLFLEGLWEWGKQGSLTFSTLSSGAIIHQTELAKAEMLTWFFFINSCTVWRLWP